MYYSKRREKVIVIESECESMKIDGKEGLIKINVVIAEW